MPRANDPNLRPRKKLAQKEIIFEYFAPAAEAVFLAGTFNHWAPDACPLKRERDGKWKTALKLAPGRYEYRYRVDHVWENDQRAVECVPNAFGSWNCVITVS